RGKRGTGMRSSDWKQRFLSSTRGRIMALLRRSDRTVNELAEALELSDNTVRAHLLSLERDDLVEQNGQRRGLRKPHYTYRLTPAAEQLFLEACNPLLDSLLSMLTAQLTSEAFEALLWQVGHHMAARYTDGLDGADRSERLRQALEVLRELGGLTEIVE